MNLNMILQDKEAANNGQELDECHRTLFRHIVGLRYVNQFLGERLSFSGTCHSSYRYKLRLVNCKTDGDQVFHFARIKN